MLLTIARPVYTLFTRGTIVLKYPKTNGLWEKFIQHPYSRLCRYDKPIGSMLLYWPVTWGVALASPGLPALSLLMMFWVGAWTSRSAGCIINDYFDKQFDRKVERTKMRPLASGQVSSSEAAMLLVANLLGGSYILTQLPLNALIATICILPVAGLYPLAKRYTLYPQLILGLAFNSGIVIGALTVSAGSCSILSVLSLYCCGISWTLIYDTVYAFQDIKDDKKLGLNSTAITWEHNPKHMMFRLCAVSYICCLLSCWSIPKSAYGFVLAHMFLSKEIYKVNLEDSNSCGQFFRKNTYFGLAVLLTILTGKFYQNLNLTEQPTEGESL